MSLVVGTSFLTSPRHGQDKGHPGKRYYGAVGCPGQSDLGGFCISHTSASCRTYDMEEATLPLLDVTRGTLNAVEKDTGYPAKFLEDPNLPTLAKVHMARGNVPAHLSTTNPHTMKASTT